MSILNNGTEKLLCTSDGRPIVVNRRIDFLVNEFDRIVLPKLLILGSET